MYHKCTVTSGALCVSYRCRMRFEHPTTQMRFQERIFHFCRPYDTNLCSGRCDINDLFVPEQPAAVWREDCERH